MPQTANFPLEALGQIGPAAGVIVVVVLFLRHVGDRDKQFTAELRAITDQFSAKVGEVMRQVIESNERVERSLRDLALEMRDGKPVAKE